MTFASIPDGRELSPRERAVLSAVVERHIQTAEPVSSSQLCAHYDFGCSPATVRNDMVRLEEAGYLSHPYTSAGKIPTVSAYRYAVERLLAAPQPEDGGRPGLQGDLLESVREVDQMIKLTAGVLAAVSQLLAVSWVAGRGDERLARVELLRLSGRKLLLVTFTEAAEEIHHTLDLPEPASTEMLTRAAHWVNERGRGLTGRELSRLAREAWPVADRRLGEILRRALAAIGASLGSPARAEMAVEGAGNLIAQPEFNNVGTVRRLVSMLDRREELLQSFAAPGLERGGLRVVVGGGRPLEGLPPLSFVTIGIGLQDGGSARLGVVGPLRMAYGPVISLIGETARTLSRAVARAEA